MEEETARTDQSRIQSPSDGTYPPRIVAPGRSYWLRDGGEVSLGKDVRVVQRNQRWVLLPGRTPVWVNGQQFDIEQPLKDGDYIRFGRLFGRFRAIYEADPVSDYRQMAAELFDHPTQINPSRSLRKWVQISGTGLSFDGGKTVVSWDQIVRIDFALAILDLRSATIRVNERGKARKVSTKLSRIRHRDLSVLFQWLMYSAPYALSLHFAGSPDSMDGYIFVAQMKLILPAEANQKLLPEAPEKILGSPLEPSNRQMVVLLGVMLLVLAILTVKPKDLSLDSILLIIHASLLIASIFAVIIGIIALLTFSPKLLPWLFRRIIHRSTDNNESL